jgi:hypothetical protein
MLLYKNRNLADMAALFRKQAIVSLMTFGLLAGAASPAPAQVIEVITAGGSVASSALLGKAVRDIIADARLQASSLLAEGQRTGNALLIRGADELSVAVDNASRLLSQELDRAFERLDQQKQDVLLGVARATKAAEGLAERAYLAKDTLSLDTRSILGSLPLTDEVFVLQRVDGLTHLEKDTDYSFRLIGSYVGLPASGYSTKLSLEIEGRPVKDIKVSPVELHVADITLPNATIAPLFDTGAVKVVEAELKVEYTSPSRFLWVFPRDKTDVLSSKLHLVLYPSYAGEAKVAARSIVYGWKPINSDSRSQTGPNAHCSSRCKDWYGIPWSFDMTVSTGIRNPPIEGDIRIASARCVGAPGSHFDEDLRADVLDSGARARCSVRARSHPATYLLTIEREQWKPVSDREATLTTALHYDQATELRIPKDAKTIRMTGKLLSGEGFDFIVGDTSAGAAIEIVRQVENANDTSLFIRARRPEGLK